LNNMIPYGHQWVDNQDRRAVAAVLKSDFITQGPAIDKFEAALCAYTGARFAVAVSNGTAALHLACMASGLRPGEEVITSAITFVASANCALYCGARPVFADIEPDTLNIGVEYVRKLITGKTRIIIPVHFAGQPCDLRAFKVLARKNRICLIEDAAHALGAEYRGAKIGSCKYSDMAIFSFHPVKSITTGEGGAILTNSRRFYDRLRCLRSHGITKENLSNPSEGAWYYEMRELGFNYRICDIQAALGLSQLKKLDRFIQKRHSIARQYTAAFRNNPYFDISADTAGTVSALHLYPLRLKNVLLGKRKAIFSRLRETGIGVQVHYIPVYLQPYYRNLGFRPGLCPNAEDYYNRAISIPIYPSLSKAQVKLVIERVFEVCKDALTDE
jgi:UDP-4-amino-4,6-dideoxy-N-acetyl-beta-L-altrosamine transaminase